MNLRKAAYEKKKEKLAQSLIDTGDQPIGLHKKTSNLFRHRKQHKTLNVKNFNKVIGIDVKNKIAEVEGMTPYETLVRETLRHGLLPTVVPELKSITIGGATAGLGIESSSFKYGLVHETVTEMEVMLSDGTIVTCTSEQNSDLYYGIPNSYGTLGYVLKLKVQLVRAKKYVKIKHVKHDNSKKYFKELEKYCKANYDFVDGTIFSENEMYITLGTFVDEALYTSNYKYMNAYYKSIRQKKEDYLTTHDYIWRWDTDWFWCSKHFGMQNKIIRLLLGKLMLKSTMYWKLMKLNNKYPIVEKLKKIFRPTETESIIQDIEVPIENAHKYTEFFHKNIGIKPVWVCPLKPTRNNPLYPMKPEKLYVNFGFWDVIPSTKEKGHYNKKIEKKVSELHGKKSLYSSSYYTKEEFWKEYNKQEYDALKTKYDPQQKFKDLYQKCVKAT